MSKCKVISIRRSGAGDFIFKDYVDGISSGLPREFGADRRAKFLREASLFETKYGPTAKQAVENHIQKLAIVHAMQALGETEVALLASKLFFGNGL